MSPSLLCIQHGGNRITSLNDTDIHAKKHNLRIFFASQNYHRTTINRIKSIFWRSEADLLGALDILNFDLDQL